jgi:cell division protein FtsA
LAIDIGSTKVAAVIAEIDEFGAIKITGHGSAKSNGVKKGVITNIELAAKSIKKALNDARRIAGNNISLATVSISNAYAKSQSSSGIVNIPHKDISIKEIKRVMDTALYNANIPNEYEVIHVLPYNFKVDDQDFIEDPYGMNATRMEVDTNIVITQKSSLSNLKKAVRSAGLEIEGIVLNSYASAIATMGEDEKELGVAVIDMGGQTSSMIVHVGNSIRYNDFLGVGSNHITNDLSMALHTPLHIAEDVKTRYGNLLEVSSDTIELPVIGDEKSKNLISLEIVHSVILARVEEALMILSKSLDKSALREQIGAGVILTGGMTKLRGIRELAQAVFHGMPVRIAMPHGLGGLFEELKDPSYSTVIGLLLYQAGKHTQYEIDNSKELLHHKEGISEEGIRDIELGRQHSVPENRHNNTRERAVIKNEISASSETVPRKAGKEGIQFTDLPVPDRGNGNLFGKIVNWAKQLF